jgi:molybdopterin-guanine dinucleotide biosynthesis protein A
MKALPFPSAAGAALLHFFCMSAATFILAGGKSERMGPGQDKATLRLGGRTLLEIMREKAQAVTGDVRIVGPRSRFGEEAVEDIFPGQGPLAGIHAALASTTADRSLMLAVDLPFLDVKFLAHLLREAEHSSAAVVVPRVGRGWQPLCAVYRKDFGAIAEAALRAGQNKIDALYPQVQLRIVDEEEIRKFAFSLAMFDNLNSPADLERAEQRLR